MHRFPGLAEGEVLLLDGGLATELEARGHALDPALWSGRILAEAPDTIRAVHRAYLDAGSDVITTAGYQASLEGLQKQGFSREAARELVVRSVSLARDARDARHATPRRPSVAASIASFGAFLADGSEYRGRYGVSAERLREFHGEHMDLSWEAGPDLLAFETLPDAFELEVVLDLWSARPEIRGWISFSCADPERLHDGSPVRDAAAACAEVPGVVAVGVNCVAPRFVAGLIEELRAGAPRLPVAVYPNSGEPWDAKQKTWTGTGEPADFAHRAVEWRERGASIFGGCCRTGPEHIRALGRALRGCPRSDADKGRRNSAGKSVGSGGQGRERALD